MLTTVGWVVFGLISAALLISMVAMIITMKCKLVPALTIFVVIAGIITGVFFGARALFPKKDVENAQAVVSEVTATVLSTAAPEGSK